MSSGRTIAVAPVAAAGALGTTYGAVAAESGSVHLIRTYVQDYTTSTSPAAASPAAPWRARSPYSRAAVGHSS